MVWIFFIGQILNGVGASPLFTLGVTYIDENVSKKMSSVYLGEWKCFSFYSLFFKILFKKKNQNKNHN